MGLVLLLVVQQKFLGMCGQPLGYHAFTTGILYYTLLAVFILLPLLPYVRFAKGTSSSSFSSLEETSAVLINTFCDTAPLSHYHCHHPIIQTTQNHLQSKNELYHLLSLFYSTYSSIYLKYKKLHLFQD